MLAFALALGVLGPSLAATPGAGTVSDSTKVVTWSGPPKAPATSCGSANNTACDNFKLTIVPPTYQFQVVIKLQPFVGDWDMEVYGPSGTKIDGSGAAPGQLELVTLTNPPAGTYTVAGVPFAPAVDPTTGNSYTASATLKQAEATQQPPPGSEPLTYSVYPAPNGLGTGAGEPSIGANWKSGRTMVQAGLQTLRLTWDDCSSPATADWTDVTFLPESLASLDPIGYCDSRTGRYIAAQLSGTTSLMAHTDDDGDNWLQEQGPLNGGVDHETVGGGPFHAPLTRDPNGLLYPDAVYYCSQDLGPALCARSDDGGLNFGPAVTMWTTECSGLHGHVKVAPNDGTVYVPAKNCDGKQGVAVSENNGITWTVKHVTGSSAGTWDPSVAVGALGTVYFAYGDGDGHMKVAVSHDRGDTWGSIRDVGAPLGVVQTAFPAAIAGDDGRAAVSWLGSTSTVPGASGDDPNWPGEWHLYIATTYDGGDTWTTVDATPNDPVQRGSICAGGTLGCPNGSRNLLDFNDMTVDKFGRVLAVFADGCTGACATGPPNTRSELATVVRQVNGKRLFSAYDILDVPSAPAVTAKSDPGPPPVNHIAWTAPDDHGSAITGYKVYRRTSSGTYSTTPLASVGPTVRSYDDSALVVGQAYFYKVTATNAVGESLACREVSPTGGGLTEDPCSVPGLTVATDPSGDQNPAGSSQEDIEKLSVAGAFLAGTPKLVFTMEVANLSSPPLNASWRTFWTSSNGMQYFVDMNTFVTAANPTGQPVFSYGTFDGTIFTAQGAADGGTFAADGTISITIATSKIGNPQPGDSLTGITGRTQLLVGGAGTGLLATIDNAGTGSYVVRSCVSGAPDAVDDSATTAENTPVTITVLTNDNDGGSPPITVAGVSQPANGTATDNGNGTITYRPNLNFTGLDTFTYTIRNARGLTDTATVRVTVTPFCPRTATGTFNDTLEPTPKPGWTVNTAQNNLGPASPTWASTTDPNAHSATHSFFSDATTLDLKDDRLIAPAQDLSSTSQLIFWHRFGFENTFDGGVLEVSKDGGQTWVDVLAGSGSFGEGGYNGTISTGFGSAIAGRQAWTGGPINAATASMTKVVVNLGAFAGDGVKIRFRLATDPLAIGSLPGAGWWIDDIQFTNTLVVSACNRPPVANDDSAGTLKNTAVTVNVVANDADPDNDTLTVQSVTTPAHGTAQVVSSSSVKYTPSTNYVGSDTFNYTISDGHGHTASAKVTITVSDTANQSPTAVDDSATTQQDTPVTIGVLDNDSDPDGDPLSVTNASDPPHGTTAINANNTITYTPDSHYFGADSFSYTISDGRGGTDAATVSITVDRATNRNPDAVDDSATTQQETAVTINVRANDSDPDGDPLTVTAVSDPPHGSAVRNADNTVTYTPDNGFSGNDSFTYTISDGRGGTDTATVNVFVEPAPTPAGTKATGGGWIPGPGKNNKSNFGFNAQLQGAVATGRLTYDSGNGGISLKGTVNMLSISRNTADFSGSCTLPDGSTCTFKVHVEDKKEPGKGADLFSIQVSKLGSLYHQNSGVLGDGNIQVH